MHALSTDLMIRRKSELLEAEVDGELVALQIDKGTCYGFNRSATRIWQLAEQPILMSDLCAALVGEFEVDRGTCEREVAEMVRELEREGLIETSSAGAAATRA